MKLRQKKAVTTLKQIDEVDGLLVYENLIFNERKEEAIKLAMFDLD